MEMQLAILGQILVGLALCLPSALAATMLFSARRDPLPPARTLA